MLRKRNDYEDEVPAIITDGVFMGHISGAIDSFEMEEYTLTVTFRGRKISQGFEMKSPKVSVKKIKIQAQ